MIGSCKETPDHHILISVPLNALRKHTKILSKMSSRIAKFFSAFVIIMFIAVICLTIDELKYEGLNNIVPVSFLQLVNLSDGKGELKKKKPLPETAIVPRVWQKYPGKTWRGLQLPVITAQPMGRLGNVMGEYATLYAMGRVYGATVRQHPGMKKQLETIFPNLTMPLVPGEFTSSEWTEIPYLTFINYAKAESAAAGILGPHLFLTTGWPFEIQLFNTYRQDILKELTFSPALQKEVSNFWEKNLNDSSHVLVGVHVRRTDYVNFIKQFKTRIPEKPYFRRAMQYYRNKYPNVLFVVASDDMSYVRKNFGNESDVLFAPGSPRELDMALLTSCNHSIITTGSFGFWTGYLSGGEVLYPNINTTYIYQFQINWYELGQLDFFTPIAVN